MSSETFFGHTKESQQEALKKVRTFLKPAEATFIIDQVEYLEKCRYLTLQMKKELFAQVPIPHVARACRLSTHTLIVALLDGISKNIKTDFLVEIQKQIPLNQLEISLRTVTTYIRKREAAGGFILDKEKSKTEV